MVRTRCKGLVEMVGRTNKESQFQGQKSRSLVGQHGLIALWGVARVPLILVALYLFRDPLLHVLERQFDLVGITNLVITLASTPVTRVIIALIFTTAVLTVLWSTRCLVPRGAYLGTLAVALFVAATMLWYSQAPMVWALVPTILLATSLWGGHIGVTKGLSDSRVMTYAVGFAELFLFRRYVHWLYRLVMGRLAPDSHAIVVVAEVGVVLIAAGWLTVGLGRDGLVAAEQHLRMSPQVSVVARGNFNDLALSADGHSLFAAGHGLPRVRKYDVRDFGAAPLESDVDSGFAQSFTYIAVSDELYVFNPIDMTLLRFDGGTLRLQLSHSVPEVSPGDVWLSVDSTSGAVVIASEADEQVGSPFIVIDRETGGVLDRSDIDAGSLLHHPTKPQVYLSYFRRLQGVLTYDVARREVTARTTESYPPLDRMIYHAAVNEVLVTVPTESKIVRLDADTLRQKGQFHALFGVRVLAIDTQRNLMLAGSLATGMVVVIDLATGTWRDTHYLGPWLRTIVLNSDLGTAYVSSNGVLYELRYMVAR